MTVILKFNNGNNNDGNGHGHRDAIPPHYHVESGVGGAAFAPEVSSSYSSKRTTFEDANGYVVAGAGPGGIGGTSAGIGGNVGDGTDGGGGGDGGGFLSRMNALPPIGGWEQYKSNDDPSSPTSQRQYSSVAQPQGQAPQDDVGYVQGPPQDLPPSSSSELESHLLLPQQQAEQWTQIVTGQDAPSSTTSPPPDQPPSSSRQSPSSAADAYNVASVNIPLNVPGDATPSASGGGGGGVDALRTLSNFKDTWDPYETTDIPMFWHS